MDLGFPIVQTEPTFELHKDIAVLLTKDVVQKLFGYAYATTNEISCLGVVSQKDDYIFTIEKLFLLDQEGSGAGTEMDEAAIAKLMEDMIKEEGGSDDVGNLKCWVHSHPGGLGAFWSGTDDATARRLASDYLISIVVADNFRVKCRIDSWSPLPFTVDDVPVYVEHGIDIELSEAIKKEVEDKVRDCGHYVVWTGNGRGGYAGGHKGQGQSRHHSSMANEAYDDFMDQYYGGGYSHYGHMSQDSRGSHGAAGGEMYGLRGAEVVSNEGHDSYELCSDCGSWHRPGDQCPAMSESAPSQVLEDTQEVPPLVEVEPGVFVLEEYVDEVKAKLEEESKSGDGNTD